jgi:hypothetical protein
MKRDLGHSDLVRIATRLIVEEALEGEVSNRLGRECYELGDSEKTDYLNVYWTRKVNTAAEATSPLLGEREKV